MNTTIGERSYTAVKARARMMGKTTREFAIDIGLSDDQVRRWRSCNHTPTGEALQKMYFAGCDVIWVLSGGKHG